MKRNKWLACGLAVTMILGLGACGNNETASGEASASKGTDDVKQESTQTETEEKKESSEPVVLEWWYRGNGIQKDTEMVEEAFNELLKTYPGMENVTVNFNCYTGSDYKNAVVLAQSADQQIDVLNTVGLSLAEEVEKGTYLGLDEYLEQNSQLKDELPDCYGNLEALMELPIWYRIIREQPI